MAIQVSVPFTTDRYHIKGERPKTELADNSSSVRRDDNDGDIIDPKGIL